MRFFLVDQIVEWKAGDSARGLKCVSMSEDYLEFHFPGNPVMPGVLLLEALAQLAGWLEAASSGFENWLLLERVDRAGFYGFALPGDQVELEVVMEKDAPAGERIFQASASVGGKKKVTAGMAGRLVPLAGLEDVDGCRRQFEHLTRTWRMK